MTHNDQNIILPQEIISSYLISILNEYHHDCKISFDKGKMIIESIIHNNKYIRWNDVEKLFDNPNEITYERKMNIFINLMIRIISCIPNITIDRDTIIIKNILLLNFLIIFYLQLITNSSYCFYFYV